VCVCVCVCYSHHHGLRIHEILSASDLCV